MISNQCGGDNGNSETASDITPQISDSQTAYDNNVVTSEETSEIYLEHLRSQILPPTAKTTLRNLKEPKK